jgi:hypothetical protein
VAILTHGSRGDVLPHLGAITDLPPACGPASLILAVSLGC